MRRRQVADTLLSSMRSNGLRITLARRVICQALSESEESFITARSLHEQIQKHNVPIDTSTLYRTLTELCEIGVLHYIHFGERSGAWHLTFDSDHQHLLCESCGDVLEVPLSNIEPFFAMIRSQYDFHPAMHHFLIVGSCGSCRSEDAPPV